MTDAEKLKVALEVLRKCRDEAGGFKPQLLHNFGFDETAARAQNIYSAASEAINKLEAK